MPLFQPKRASTVNLHWESKMLKYKRIFTGKTHLYTQIDQIYHQNIISRASTF